jgi:acyl-CoA thioester hydrolase
VRVYYEDTDAGGVVYHSQYLNFLERARTEWLRHLGFEQTELRDNLQVLIVVHSLQIAFKKPAKFNDLLTVKCQITTLGNSSWQCAQRIYCGDELLIEAQVKTAFIDSLSFKPIRIPAAVMQVAKTLILENILE